MFHPITLSLELAYDEYQRGRTDRRDALRVARNVKPGLLKHLGVRLGDALISIGLRLRGRYEPVLYPSVEARQSSC